jgi:hypothetical protein
MEPGQAPDPAAAGGEGSGGHAPRVPAREVIRDRPAGNRVARIVVILAALAVVVVGAAGAFTATRQSVVHPAGVTADKLLKVQMESVQRQLSAQVPARSTIYFSKNNSSLWQQRIVEFATMDGIIVVLDPARAEFRLSLVKTTAAESAGGLRLVVQRNG